MADVTIQLKPFVRQLWAAIYSKGADRHRVYEQQVHVTLTWIYTLFKDRSKMMATRFLQPPSTQAAIVCDTSPTGGGAAVYFMSADIGVKLKTLAEQKPMVRAAKRWTTTDEYYADALIGVPGSQARWEAYAAISALIILVKTDLRGSLWHHCGW